MRASSYDVHAKPLELSDADFKRYQEVARKLEKAQRDVLGFLGSRVDRSYRAAVARMHRLMVERTTILYGVTEGQKMETRCTFLYKNLPKN